jgi:predicted metal-dependent HD superfamily phosphohydrolase
MDVRERWPLLTGQVVREELVAAYTQPIRGYHDLTHLAEVLDRLSELAQAGESFEPLPVRLAAWFHDGVYDGLPDAEERSALWAENALRGLVGPEVCSEAARLVRLTQTHRPGSGDANGEALCDADLAILAAPRERYAGYAAAVRREYAHVPDEAFRHGRAAILADLAAKPTLFHTGYARTQWEGAARENLARELAELT